MNSFMKIATWKARTKPTIHFTMSSSRLRLLTSLSRWLGTPQRAHHFAPRDVSDERQQVHPKLLRVVE